MARLACLTSHVRPVMKAWLETKLGVSDGNVKLGELNVAKVIPTAGRCGAVNMKHPTAESRPHPSLKLNMLKRMKLCAKEDLYARSRVMSRAIKVEHNGGSC